MKIQLFSDNETSREKKTSRTEIMAALLNFTNDLELVILSKSKEIAFVSRPKSSELGTFLRNFAWLILI